MESFTGLSQGLSINETEEAREDALLCFLDKTGFESNHLVKPWSEPLG